MSVSRSFICLDFITDIEGGKGGEILVFIAPCCVDESYAAKVIRPEGNDKTEL